jgi:hypothetical protein
MIVQLLDSNKVNRIKKMKNEAENALRSLWVGLVVVFQEDYANITSSNSGNLLSFNVR